ncbi:MAG: hypothetical protein HY553_05150 [Elusimicrobia bacterium]|nr:hypothetical protein [Elusimicrobiota bacterium]
MGTLLLAILLAAPGAAEPAAPLTGEGLIDFSRAQLEPIRGFSEPERRVACGLIAAEALMRFFYQDTGLDAIADLKHVGRGRRLWSLDGMAGPQAELVLLEHMGRDVQLEQGPSLRELEGRIVDSLERGFPVILSTWRHYFFIQGHDRAGSYYVGNTGLIMAYRGLGAGPWMTLAEMARNGDLVNGLIVPVEAYAN